MDTAIGQFVSFTVDDDTIHRFQNFFIGETVTYNNNDYIFLPFGFSGVTVNRTGDGVEATLLLPNLINTTNSGTNLSVNWAVDAMDFYDDDGIRKTPWVAHVQVMVLEPDDKTSFQATNPLYEYYGAVSGGSWDETSLSLSLGTIIDAVGTDVPMRRLTQKTVGSLPVTSGVRLQ